MAIRAAPLIAAAGVLSAIALLSVSALWVVYDHPWFPKEDWRQATAFISGSLRPGDDVYSAIPEPYDGLTYYDRQLEGQVRPLALSPFYPNGIAVDAAISIRQQDWVVIYPVGSRLDVQTAELEKDLAAAGMQRHDFNGLVVFHG